MGRREKAQKREGEAPPEEAGEGRIKHGELLVRLSGLWGDGAQGRSAQGVEGAAALTGTVGGHDDFLA